MTALIWVCLVLVLLGMSIFFFVYDRPWIPFKSPWWLGPGLFTTGVVGLLIIGTVQGK